jgi:hypothetical protein
MSQRIQDLANQAKDSVPKGILGVNDWVEQYNKIFAELIVRECAELFHLVHTDEQYQRRIDKTILKHFGVLD